MVGTQKGWSDIVIQAETMGMSWTHHAAGLNLKRGNAYEEKWTEKKKNKQQQLLKKYQQDIPMGFPSKDKEKKAPHPQSIHFCSFSISGRMRANTKLQFGLEWRAKGDDLKLNFWVSDRMTESGCLMLGCAGGRLSDRISKLFPQHVENANTSWGQSWALLGDYRSRCLLPRPSCGLSTSRFSTLCDPCVGSCGSWGSELRHCFLQETHGPKWFAGESLWVISHTPSILTF